MAQYEESFGERHYAALAAAFCRGWLGLPCSTSDETALGKGRAAGLRLHRFKRTAPLPRVQRVLGILHGLAPRELLDVGSGRGVFLWPLLDAFSELAVTALDVRPDRFAQLEAVSRGGIARLTAVEANVVALPFPTDHFDVTCALEVLEHLPEPAAAARELMRVSRRAVVVSVPSQPDDNPGHLRCYDQASLTTLLGDAGAANVNVDYVRGHIVAVAMV